MMTTEPVMQVLLVGRTGLEQALRREAGVSLARAADALDAIGELAELGDGGRPVVIVSAEAQPLGEEAVQWIESLRRLRSDAMVLRMALPGQKLEHWTGAGAKPFDGFVPHEADADALHRIVVAARTGVNGKAGRATEPARAEANEAAPDQEIPAVEPTATKVEPSVAPAPLEAGDEHLATLLVQGRGVEQAAIELASRRLGREARLESGSEGSGAPVAWRGVQYGRLIAEGADESELRKHASWLATWLRLEEQQAELRKSAFTDPLTGAWNRRYFEHFLAGVLERARAQRVMVTVLVFDIDDFKMYNDRYGHAAGDEILIETVRLLRSVIRPTDRVCRLGGDEFVVVFDEPQGPRQPGSRPPESVFDISRRFQKQICEHRFPKLGAGAPGTLTISGGLATYPWDGRTAAELLERADQLALESKRQGKNAITFGPGAERMCGLE